MSCEKEVWCHFGFDSIRLRSSVVVRFLAPLHLLVNVYFVEEEEKGTEWLTGKLGR